jgi:hypothetical protein
MIASTKDWLVPVIIAAIVVALGLVALFTNPFKSLQDDSAVRDVAIAFVATQSDVVVSGTSEEVRKNVTEKYGPFVSEALLKQWMDNPASAPGRTASSSASTGEIAIDTVTNQGAGYVVVGRIVREADASERPVVLFFLKENGAWKILAYQEQVTAL